MNKFLIASLMLISINLHASDEPRNERLEGLKKLLEEGSVSEFNDWYPVCNKDRFNGSKSCTLSKDTVLIMLKDGTYAVSVGKRHYPRSKSAIKIDNNATIYGYEGILESPKKVIEQLKQGKKVFTRYQEWPYQHNRDSEINLTGFPEKFEEMLELYRRL